MKQRVVIRPTGDTRRSMSSGRSTEIGLNTTPVRRPFVIEGDFDFEVETLEHFVRVEFLNGRGGIEYTYIDPSGDVQVGDLVEVDTVYGTNIAKVTALGKGAYNGPFKSITARLSREVL